MHKSITNLNLIKEDLKAKINNYHNVKIIAVSKTFPIEAIMPLIEYGHLEYGENKVQEAIAKWTDVKLVNPNIKLHLIGKLQTNKVKHVIPLFDYIFFDQWGNEIFKIFILCSEKLCSMIKFIRARAT